MISTILRTALVLTAACALSAGVSAQTPPDAACPPAAEMKAAQLYGLWSARFANPPAGLPARATMLLERHAEFADSLAGVVSRDLGPAGGSKAIAGHAAKAVLAGDLESGMLLLDESSDNVSITGTWNGEMVEGSAARCSRAPGKTPAAARPTTRPTFPSR
jgi:hypothetical protein